MSVTSISVVILSLLSSVCAVGEDGWNDLFNGKNLDGWVSRGGKATYSVENGCIVGTSTPDTPNTFLCTPRDYRDFILEYEFKVDARLNSGVQVRSQCFSTPISFEWQGRNITVPAGVVHGYQIEIDPESARDRWWSGGIYDESARDWLFPGALGGDKTEFTDQGRRIFNQGGWNRVRVEAIGDSIRTIFNGHPRASIVDSRVGSGFIGLQVHNILGDRTKEGAQVRWRNLRIREIPVCQPNTLSDQEKASGWRLLWDGKSTDGWRGVHSAEFPVKGWEIKNGVLMTHETGGRESTEIGDIITREKFSDFELQLEFKVARGANSGIMIFVDPDLNKGGLSSIGLEYQILDDDGHRDGKQSGMSSHTVGSLYDLIPAPVSKRIKPPGEWNHAHIVSSGKHVEFRLNGGKTVEFDRGSNLWRDLVASSKFKAWSDFGELADGHILLQDHGNEVCYRNIKILTPASK